MGHLGWGWGIWRRVNSILDGHVRYSMSCSWWLFLKSWIRPQNGSVRVRGHHGPVHRNTEPCVRVYYQRILVVYDMGNKFWNLLCFTRQLTVFRNVFCHVTWITWPNSGTKLSQKCNAPQKDIKLSTGLRVVNAKAILFLESMSERGRSDKERLWIWITSSSIDFESVNKFKFRVVPCRTRLFPTLISKITWLEYGPPYIQGRRSYLFETLKTLSTLKYLNFWPIKS